MLAVTLRAADAYARAARPLSNATKAERREAGPIGSIIGVAILVAAVVSIILLRVLAYAAFHSDLPVYDRIIRAFG